MDWCDERIRGTLLALWETGQVTRSGTREALIERLLEAGLLAQTSRYGVYAIPESQRAKFRSLLDRLWPEWKTTFEALQERSLPRSTEGLQALRRPLSMSALPPLLHHKTYAALVRAHSKMAVAPPEGVVLTRDDVLRMRTSKGFALRSVHGGLLECDLIMAGMGEVIVPERVLLNGCQPCGELPQCIMTIENVGAFVDMPVVDGLLAVFQPGWNSRLARQFIGRLPVDIPWLHFGDLDVSGLEIYGALHESPGRPSLWIPSFWMDYADTHWQAADLPWPQLPPELADEELLKVLVTRQRWLEQEPIVVDQRFESALKGAIRFISSA